MDVSVFLISSWIRSAKITGRFRIKVKRTILAARDTKIQTQNPIENLQMANVCLNSLKTEGDQYLVVRKEWIRLVTGIISFKTIKPVSNKFETVNNTIFRTEFAPQIQEFLNNSEVRIQYSRQQGKHYFRVLGIMDSQIFTDYCLDLGEIPVQVPAGVTIWARNIMVFQPVEVGENFDLITFVPNISTGAVWTVFDTVKLGENTTQMDHVMPIGWITKENYSLLRERTSSMLLAEHDPTHPLANTGFRLVLDNQLKDEITDISTTDSAFQAWRFLRLPHLKILKQKIMQSLVDILAKPEKSDNYKPSIFRLHQEYPCCRITPEMIPQILQRAELDEILSSKHSRVLSSACGQFLFASKGDSQVLTILPQCTYPFPTTLQDLLASWRKSQFSVRVLRSNLSRNLITAILESKPNPGPAWLRVHLFGPGSHLSCELRENQFDDVVRQLNESNKVDLKGFLTQFQSG